MREVILEGNKLPQNKLLLESAIGKTMKSGSNVVSFHNLAYGKSHVKYRLFLPLPDKLN